MRTAAGTASTVPAPSLGDDPGEQAPSPPSRGSPWRSTLVAVLALLAFAVVASGHPNELHRLGRAAPLPVLGVLLTFLGARALQAEVLRLLIGGGRISRGEGFLLMMLASYTNLLLPRLGLGTTAVWLKRHREVDYARFATATAASTGVQISVVGVAGLAAQAGLDRLGRVPADWLLSLLFAACGLGGALAMACAPALGTLAWPRRLARWLVAMAGMAREWRRAWLGLVALHGAGVVLRAARLWLAFAALGARPDPLGILLASALADLALLASLVPSALGLREAVILSAAAAMGVEPSLAVAAAVLDRLVWTLAVVAMAPLATFRLLRPAHEART